MKTRSILLMAVAALGSLMASAAAPPGDAAVPGDVIIEPPTLQSLGFEWPLSGDGNRNSVVGVSYRRKGTEDWRAGLPLLRLGGEEMRYLSLDYVAPSMFAGSLFDLEPDTSYEVRLRLADPDGVNGMAERLVEARTRAEPKPSTDGRSIFTCTPASFRANVSNRRSMACWRRSIRVLLNPTGTTRSSRAFSPVM